MGFLSRMGVAEGKAHPFFHPYYNRVRILVQSACATMKVPEKSSVRPQNGHRGRAGTRAAPAGPKTTLPVNI
jgi:hypothetical protein